MKINYRKLVEKRFMKISICSLRSQVAVILPMASHILTKYNFAKVENFFWKISYCCKFCESFDEKKSKESQKSTRDLYGKDKIELTYGKRPNKISFCL